VISKGFEKSGAATRAIQFASIAAEKGHYVDECITGSVISGGGVLVGKMTNPECKVFTF
jgi:hypothetical protein